MPVDQEPACVCRQCGAELKAAAKFCRACGSAVLAPSLGVTCTRCQHVNPADSRFCRGCGTALTPDPATGALAMAEPRRPSPLAAGARRGPSTTLIAVVVVLVAVGGAGVALALLAGGKSGHDVHHALVGAATSTVVTEGGPVIAASSTTERSPSANASGRWPIGFAGYTVGLASDLVRSDATRAVAKARSAGLREVGVLRSSDYLSLKPGYWFVFSGVYSTVSQARRGVPQAVRAGFAGAYVRRVAQQLTHPRPLRQHRTIENAKPPHEFSRESLSTEPKVTVPTAPAPSNLVIKEIIKGSGSEAKAGDSVNS